MRSLAIILGPIVAIALLGIVFGGDPLRPAAASLLASLALDLGGRLLPGPKRVNVAGRVETLADAPAWTRTALASGALCLIGVYIACGLWAVGVLP